jgi:hypothetical protein
MSASPRSVRLDAADVLISRVGFGGSLLCSEQLKAFSCDLTDDRDTVPRTAGP